MRNELLGVLKKAARKLLVRRMLESAAVVGATCGFCAAGVVLIWWLASVTHAGTAALAAVLVVLGMAMRVHPRAGRILGLSTGAAPRVGVLCTLVGVAGAVAWLGVRGLRVEPAWLPPELRAVLIPVIVPGALLLGGLLVGAVMPLRRGVSPLRAAVYLDVHGKTAERLSTAAEAALAPEADGDARSDALYAQAMDVLTSQRPQKMSVWRRTRKTPAALLLAVALCVVLGLLPESSRTGAPQLSDVPAAVAAMSPERAEELTHAFRRIARERESQGELSKSLHEAADAVGKGNQEMLRRALASVEGELAKASWRRRYAMMTAILDATGLLGDEGAGEPRQADGQDAFPRGRAAPVQRRADAEELVPVYDPQYAKELRSKRAGPAPAPGKRREDAAARLLRQDGVPLDQAWRRARRRADEKLNRGEVPPAYRQIVRDFFAPEP